MWPDGEGPTSAQGRPSTGSEVVIDERGLGSLSSSKDTPTVTNLNVTKSSRVHIGPKFLNITQNVHNTEVVKDLSLGQYLVAVVRNTTCAERVVCTCVVILLVLCIALIVYYTSATDATGDAVDVAPHEWNITRAMWLAQPYNNSPIPPEYNPLRLVIIQHSVSQECDRFISCAAELRNLQSYFINYKDYDLPYNFAVGNDGRIYECRGWGIEGAHTKGYNRCAVGIGFIGDYRDEKGVHTQVTPAQLNRTLMLMDEGVKAGFLHPHYIVVGAKDLQSTTESPGTNLYNAIQLWSHYDHSHRFRNMTCDQITEAPMSDNND